MSFNNPLLNLLSDKEKGYLVGLFIGDGYSCHSKKDRHYVVEFFLNSIKDQDIEHYLLMLLNKININFYTAKDKRYNCNKVRVSSSKVFFNYLRDISQEIRNDISKHNKDFLIGFLSGFIDAEGYIGKGTIAIAQKDGLIMQKMKQICNILKINFSLKECQNTPSGTIWRGYISTRFKYVPHSSQKVRREYDCLS